MEGNVLILLMITHMTHRAFGPSKRAEDITNTIQLVEDVSETLTGEQNTLPRDNVLQASLVAADDHGPGPQFEPRTAQALDKEIVGEVQLRNAEQMAGASFR